MWDRRAQLVRVKDGDTVRVTLDQGFDDTKKIDVRVLGDWAPEMHEAGGPETQEFVEQWFSSLPLVEWPFIVTTTRMKTVDAEQRSFVRYVASITSPEGKNLTYDVMQFIHDQGYGGGVGA